MDDPHRGLCDFKGRHTWRVTWSFPLPFFSKRLLSSWCNSWRETSILIWLQDLASYLKKVASDEKLYAEYHQWRWIKDDELNPEWLKLISKRPPWPNIFTGFSSDGGPYQYASRDPDETCRCLSFSSCAIHFSELNVHFVWLQLPWWKKRHSSWPCWLLGTIRPTLSEPLQALSSKGPAAVPSQKGNMGSTDRRIHTSLSGCLDVSEKP